MKKNPYASPYVDLVLLKQADVLAAVSGVETNDNFGEDNYDDGWEV